VLIIAIPISTPANLFLHIPPLPFRPHFSPVNRGLGACGWCRPLNRDRDFLSICLFSRPASLKANPHPR
jgi:hypothetical protein